MELRVIEDEVTGAGLRVAGGRSRVRRANEILRCERHRRGSTVSQRDLKVVDKDPTTTMIGAGSSAFALTCVKNARVPPGILPLSCIEFAASLAQGGETAFFRGGTPCSAGRRSGWATVATSNHARRAD
ncbi:hypothetical protein Rmf_03800 [Roseomonas fluvialis]|uniref:Uncharacterized protein n=1 Tax=Roseomonas fluvialis TaxID=1750527 RepID=A0ABN6NW26_9PROT|nr:hypothetical protein Rmf_03800 [Roseomonas fluvialis]